MQLFEEAFNSDKVELKKFSYFEKKNFTFVKQPYKILRKKKFCFVW